MDALEQGTSNGWIPPEEVFLPFSDLEFTDTAAWEARSVRLAWRFIIEHPGTFCRLAARKLAIFWSPYHHIVDRATWVPVFLLSVMGLCSTFTAWKQHLLLYVLLISSMLIPIVFTSMPRFRAPLMPFLLLYSAVGLQQLYFLGKRRGHANRN
ncbi:hypothetical protein CSA56_17920 [candidate division KSB3 bacterium]|uniref:Glycosyltransferase RgtA/B/C/D-like domain-containing protein n=1 Tax=candidate division KSB3 bacterium TaxID=2044937 RepID=A0A2G6K7E4_9BACT|nr:MAG: hypothetical protein CSA56_17920 [candidate division KSB3 bacterium]